MREARLSQSKNMDARGGMRSKPVVAPAPAPAPCASAKALIAPAVDDGAKGPLIRPPSASCTWG